MEEIPQEFKSDGYYCKHYSCERSGECDIVFQANMRGGINSEVCKLIVIPHNYSDVTIELWFRSERSLFFHKIYHKDYVEDIWTIDDAVDEYNIKWGSFYPNRLELDTYRRIYKDGNLILDESRKVPFPIELMDKDMREEYEKWKEDPIKWEEDKKREKEEQEAEYRLKHPAGTEDDLPF